MKYQEHNFKHIYKFSINNIIQLAQIIVGAQTAKKRVGENTLAIVRSSSKDMLYLQLLLNGNLFFHLSENIANIDKMQEFIADTITNALIEYDNNIETVITDLNLIMGSEYNNKGLYKIEILQNNNTIKKFFNYSKENNVVSLNRNNEHKRTYEHTYSIGDKNKEVIAAVGIINFIL